MKYLDMKGRIVYGGHGVPMGVISDLLVEMEHQRIAGAIVATKGIIRSFRYVPLCRMKITCGQLHANGLGFRIRRSFLRRNSGALGTRLLGLQVLDENDVSTGRVVDLLFDIDTTELLALVVSKSYFEDLFEGSTVISCSNGMKKTAKGILIRGANRSITMAANLYPYRE